MSSKYVISELKEIGGSETLYWSNEEGWTDLCLATVFSEYEKNSISLPIGENVKWELLPNTLSHTEHNTIRNALSALKVLAMSAGDNYLNKLTIKALEIIE